MTDALALQLAEIRAAGQAAAALDGGVRTAALRRFADLVDSRRADLLAANRRDLDEQAGRIEDALYQRLKLGDGKIDALVTGVRQLADRPDPVGTSLGRTLLDDDLVLAITSTASPNLIAAGLPCASSRAPACGGNPTSRGDFAAVRPFVPLTEPRGACQGFARCEARSAPSRERGDPF